MSPRKRPLVVSGSSPSSKASPKKQKDASMDDDDDVTMMDVSSTPASGKSRSSVLPPSTAMAAGVSTISSKRTTATTTAAQQATTTTTTTTGSSSSATTSSSYVPRRQKVAVKVPRRRSDPEGETEKGDASSTLRDDGNHSKENGKQIRSGDDVTNKDGAVASLGTTDTNSAPGSMDEQQEIRPTKNRSQALWALLVLSNIVFFGLWLNVVTQVDTQIAYLTKIHDRKLESVADTAVEWEEKYSALQGKFDGLQLAEEECQEHLMQYELRAYEEEEDNDDDVLVNEECVDTQPLCETWAAAGECDSNEAFMTEACPSSCGLCGEDFDDEDSDADDDDEEEEDSFDDVAKDER